MLGIFLFARTHETLQLPFRTRAREGEWARERGTERGVVGNVSYSLKLVVLCIICVPNENFIDISNANRYKTFVCALGKFWPHSQLQQTEFNKA